MSTQTSKPSTSSDSTAKCSESGTTVPTYSATHFWSVKKFNSLQHKRGEYLESTSFYVHGDGDDPNADGTLRSCIFKLRLYPSGLNEKAEGFASVFLVVTINNDAAGEQQQYADITYRLRVGEKKYGEELFIGSRTSNRFTSTLKDWGYSNCFSRPVSAVLNRKLTITCTLTYFAKPVTMDMSPDVATVMTRDKKDLDVMSLYKKGLFTDVDIIVGKSSNKRIIKGHKLVLALKSSVFEKIFTSAFAESASNEVIIPDISADTFELMMRHMYGEEIPRDLDMNRVEELLYGSEKYELSGLKAECQNLLSSMIKADTVVRLLSMSDKYNADILKRSCHKFIRSHWKEVMKMPGWDWGTIMLHHAQALDQTSHITRANSDACSGPAKKLRKQRI